MIQLFIKYVQEEDIFFQTFNLTSSKAKHIDSFILSSKLK